jgi:hypothetical protein
MASQKGANRFVLGLVVVIAVWLISRVALHWAPSAGWVNILIGIGFLAAVIGSVVFLLRMAKSIGKSGWH